ncbi:MAG: hypothetical protein ACRDT0_24980 [Pseudonocardiaceae bacterium]
MTELTAADQHLVDTAVDLLRRRARRGRSVVASALRTTSGDVFTGMHLAATLARVSICAEAVALSSAIMAETTGFGTIVTLDYAPGLRVLIPTDSHELRGVTIESLLPAKFHRPSNT